MSWIFTGGQLLHLMSMLHCFACLHLMRREELGDHEDDAVDEVDMDTTGLRPDLTHLSLCVRRARRRSRGAGRRRRGDGSPDASDSTNKQKGAQRSALEQLGDLEVGFCNYRALIKKCVQRKQPGRNKLGVIGTPTDSEYRALYPVSANVD